jgi:hypothetical protein
MCVSSHQTHVCAVYATYNKLLTYLLTYLLIPWCRVLLEKLTLLQLVKKFPAFYGTQRFITALTSVRHLSLSWASPIQSTYPHPTSWRSIPILYTHLRLGLPSGLSPSGFPHQDPIRPLSSPIRATCPAHLILLDFITGTILGEGYRSFSSSLCNLLHSPVTSSLIAPNIFHNTIFSDTLRLRLLQYAILSSIDRIETSDRYVDFKFTVLNFIKFYVYVVILNKPKTWNEGFWAEPI